MAQPQTARITCSQCNARYDSERELGEHMKTAHRGGGSEQCSSQREGAEQDRAPKFNRAKSRRRPTVKAAQDRGAPGEAHPGKAVRRVAPAPASGCPRLVRTCMSSMGVIEILPNEDWDVHSGDPKLLVFPYVDPGVANGSGDCC